MKNATYSDVPNEYNEALKVMKEKRHPWRIDAGMVGRKKVRDRRGLVNILRIHNGETQHEKSN